MANATLSLPESVQEALQRDGSPEAERADLLAERMQGITQSLLKKLDDAITFRRSEGIETIWLNCEEAYVGIDDANRHEYSASKWSKPVTGESGVYTNSRLNVQQEVRSTAFVRLTARYVDAAKAKLGEILLPIDGRPFSLKPTPVPDLLEALESDEPVMVGDVPLERDRTEKEAAQQPAPPIPDPTHPPQAGPQGPGVPLKRKDLAQETYQRALKRAKKAEDQIFDWLVECQHAAEMRKVLFDGARLGVGVLKGPFSEIRREMGITHGPPAAGDEEAAEGSPGSVWSMEIREEVKPATKWIDPWNFFPAPECGENIHDGDYVFERLQFTTKQLHDLMDQKHYRKEAIAKVIAAGPAAPRAEENKGLPQTTQGARRGKYEGWLFHGVLTKEEACLFNASLAAQLPDQGEATYVYLIATIVNDEVIHLVLNPLDSGRFPYHTFPWQRRPDSWVGIGIAEQLQMPQRLLNAATRAMSNNAGKSAGSQIVIDEGSITPADDSWTIFADKVWLRGAEGGLDDVRKAFEIYEIPNRTDALLKIIEYALRLAEESTNIPLITQGQSGKTQPETLGGQQLQNNNANQLLRDIGYAVDDTITEPLIKQLYEWLILDPAVPDDVKGDYQIHAHGSAALVERAIQEQFIVDIAVLAVNPAYGIDPKRYFKQMAKSRRLNPEDFQYSDEELQEMEKRPPPPPPQVQAAQIRVEIEKLKLQAGQQSEKARLALEAQLAHLETQTRLTLGQMEQDRDTAYVLAQKDRTRSDAELGIMKLEVQRELALLDYANREKISLDKAKTDLAKTSMSLTVQQRLAGMDAALAAPQVAPAPAEPPGRAPNGEAFQK